MNIIWQQLRKIMPKEIRDPRWKILFFSNSELDSKLEYLLEQWKLHLQQYNRGYQEIIPIGLKKIQKLIKINESGLHD